MLRELKAHTSNLCANERHHADISPQLLRFLPNANVTPTHTKPNASVRLSPMRQIWCYQRLKNKSQRHKDPPATVITLCLDLISYQVHNHLQFISWMLKQHYVCVRVDVKLPVHAWIVFFLLADGVRPLLGWDALFKTVVILEPAWKGLCFLQPLQHFTLALRKKHTTLCPQLQNITKHTIHISLYLNAIHC